MSAGQDAYKTIRCSQDELRSPSTISCQEEGMHERAMLVTQTIAARKTIKSHVGLDLAVEYVLVNGIVMMCYAARAAHRWLAATRVRG
ncbi:hypothetical protein Tdes44962_MAKER07272 [Teratosphaeria destructans]|uniref:Uncharacterized protein n=1 Tax=Teratosphaeria destructans TaxID=418781 RepID=A0A9W7SZC4_9PEZI|nr:hypothetical protein Tdes44962_MAKER07272 [Teratosphaeria destructans]